MIQGAGSDEAWVGHDYNLSVSEGCRAKRDRGWDLMKHRHVGGKHEGRVMITT